MNIESVASLIVDVPDFPKPGIVFKDITPVLEDPSAFSSLMDLFADSIQDDFQSFAAIESRGFILGSALAARFGKGLILIRKPGKLPRETESESYELEYGTDELQVQKSSIHQGQKVVIIDDVLATGGTAAAAERLCLRAGAEVVGHRFLMELSFLGGSKKLTRPFKSLIDIAD